MPHDLSPHALAERLRQQRMGTKTAREQSETAHGSSGWLTSEEARAAGLYNDKNGTREAPLLFGRAPGGELFRYGGDGHCLTFAPTGAGKSVSVVVPNLLTYPGSVVCVDPKGAIAPITAAQRRAMGQNVVLLDPFEEVEQVTKDSDRAGQWPLLERASYNPLDMLRLSSPKSIIDDARLIASSLILQENEKNKFFSDSARALLEGVILLLAASENRELLHVENLLTLGFDSKANFAKTWLPRMRNCKEFNGHLARIANQVENFTGDGGDAIWMTLQRSLSLLASEHILDALQTSTLDFRKLKMEKPGDLGSTVYLVLPARHLHTHGAWLRLMLSVLLNQLSDSRHSRYPVLFLIDECAALGRLEILETAVGLMRGYGMKLWLIFQDLPQIERIYGKGWGTFISNSGVRQFFNVNDLETADFVSKYIGNETRAVFSQSVNPDQPAGGGNIGVTSRALLMPDEVRRIPTNEEILLYEGLKPVRANKISYWQDEEFRHLASPDPYISL